jgi:Matrixin
MLRLARFSALLAAGGVLVSATRAAAYCRATTGCEKNKEEGTLCDPPVETDCGSPLVWTRNCLGFAVQKDGSKKAGISANEARLYVRQAFAAWESAECPGGDGTTPRVHVSDLGVVDCGEVEYNDKAGNQNVVVFRDEKWPHPNGMHNIALTTVTYDSNTGAIYDADMEINTDGYNITTNDSPTSDEYDLLSVVTHESGHFLGLGHSQSDPDATMNPVYSPGSTDFRTLSDDDVAAICVTYPPTTKGPVPETCNPIPRHGFSPECLINQTEGTCAFAPAPARAPRWALILAAAAGLSVSRRKRWGRRTRTATARSGSPSSLERR